MAVDSAFNAYITGGTNSSDIAAGGIGGFQPIIGCTTITNNTCPVPDAFIAKFAQPSTTGTTPGLVTLSYFTYLGGVGTDVGLAIAVDNNSNAFVTGLTDGNFNIPPTDIPLQGTYGGGSYDAFFARILTTSSNTCQAANTFVPAIPAISAEAAPI